MTSTRTTLLDRRTIFIFVILSWLLVVEAKFSRTKQRSRNIPKRDLDTRYSNTKKKIVLIHNFYRARVDPPASNMLEMKWHKKAQHAAQKWAESCQLLIHDNPLGRWIDDFGSCGQNIFVSSTPIDWLFIAKSWYMEHKNFIYGNSKNNLTLIGHYTQMVWYNSHNVGCGFHFCGKDVAKKPFYNYICNYCPIGNNPKRLSRPYTVGKPCSKCQKNCRYKKLCTNSCPVADLWINCGDLNKTWNTWLCSDVTQERFKACKATCRCSGTIK